MATVCEKNSGDSEWLQYPTNLKNYDSLAIDGSACIEHINRLSGVLFSNGTKFKVFDGSDEADVARTLIESDDGLDAFLRKASVLDLRIFSISQDHSLSPLNISKLALLKVLGHYQISPEFLDVVCAFGDKQSSADEVSECGIYNSFDNSNYEISYQLRYVERNNRPHGDPWSLRQTGVYHKYSGFGTPQPRNLWILLHPMRKSRVFKRLEESTSVEIGAADRRTDPLRLHLLIFSSYVDNWRHFLHDMTRAFLNLEDNLMTSELHDREEYTTLNFDTLQTLRHLAGKLIPIPVILQASIKTINSMQCMNSILASSCKDTNACSKIAKTTYYLQSFERRLQNYLASCHVLQARIENMTKFLADGLNLQNQEISAESNGHLVTLTKDTVDDSATVRAVTFVTLIYLPATFISGLLGSNLFNFQDTTSNFQVSRQFWIYVVLTVPLTILTLSYWKYKTYQQAKKRVNDAKKQQLGLV